MKFSALVFELSDAARTKPVLTAFEYWILCSFKDIYTSIVNGKWKVVDTHTHNHAQSNKLVTKDSDICYTEP